MNKSITLKKIAEKWYFSLVIIPIATTYLTNYFELPDLFKNWSYTIIACLAILSGILICENVVLNTKLYFLPKEKDKRIIKELLATLDINAFQKDIAEQESWYGYDKEAIYKIIEFNEDARLISNRFADEKLNALMNSFCNAISDFNSYASVKLFQNGGDFFSPLKDSDKDYQNYKDLFCPEMNALSAKAYKELNVMLKYLNDRNYLE